MKCAEQIFDCGGYMSSFCGKPAKWKVRGFPRCGIHARANNWFVKKYGRVPIKEGAASK